ncbi:MAG: glutathione S-transferase family protein [Rhodobiaceae bacterium]|nr:glutathione S-transferase family protein [Rhodobiaceae bacterium]
MKLHGVSLSPWVRRLMVLMDEKGIEFEHVPAVPGENASAELRRMNPLGRIPVLELADGRFLPDSLAASLYLDKAFPGQHFVPQDGWARSWDVWLCEFVASAIFSRFEGTFFVQRVVRPAFEKAAPDEGKIAEVSDQIPPAYDYLEAQLEDTAYLSSAELTLADLTAASVLLNMRHAGEEVDAVRWPKLADYLNRMHARPAFSAAIKKDLELIGHISPVRSA